MKRTALLILTALIAVAAARSAGVVVGAARPDIYEAPLAGKRVALLSNHTGMVDSVTHTAAFMIARGINLTTLLSPEHGFRGTADAGEHVASGRDAATGLPVVSMFDGRRRGLPDSVLDSFDVAVVDLQDVGARFYTYYISMLDLMADCARRGKSVVILDRPNPLGMVVDGPVLDMKYSSGVGRLPIPAVHGMTLGELALMANGEGWLPGGARLDNADLTVVPVGGYTHQTRYELPVAPSPNLKTMQAIYLYPSLCFFEGTPVSVGRGTDNPFTLYGHPQMTGHRGFSFIPRPRPGAKNPPLKGRRCYGSDLSRLPVDTVIARGLDLSYLIDAYRSTPSVRPFFTKFFTLLAGTPELRRQIESGLGADEIHASWQPGLDAFRKRRAPYLLYPE